MVIHPQTNGQAESAKRMILGGMKKKLDDAKKIHEVLWSYHTTPYSTIKETLFTMVYIANAFLIEIDTLTWMRTQFCEEENKTGLRCAST